MQKGTKVILRSREGHRVQSPDWTVTHQWEGVVTAVAVRKGELRCYVLFDGGGGWYRTDELIERRTPCTSS